MARKSFLSLFLAILIALSCTAGFAEAEKTTVDFYFPVQLGGAAAELIETFAAEFEAANPDIDINPVFCGNYSDTLTKLTLALEGGDAPQLVIASYQVLTLLSMDALMPLDDYIAADGGDELLNDFYPGYMESCMYEGSYYGLPFQRSVVAMYYNKDHFTEVGLDPENPPKTWDELIEYGAKLTKKDEAGNAERWGVLIENMGAWITNALAISASPDNANIFRADGKEVYFDTEAMRTVIDFDLALRDAGASPAELISDGTAPTSFIEGMASIIVASSGNLTNINNSVDFNYGICLMPGKANEVGASIGGGGDMLMIKSDSTTQAEYDAAWKFMRYMTEPEVQARWSVGTGYIASRISSKETEILKDYFATVPQAEVAYEQLNSAYMQMSVYGGSAVSELLGNAFSSIMLGEATVDDALAYAQSEADYILSDYQ